MSDGKGKSGRIYFVEGDLNGKGAVKVMNADGTDEKVLLTGECSPAAHKGNHQAARAYACERRHTPLLPPASEPLNAPPSGPAEHLS